MRDEYKVRKMSSKCLTKKGSFRILTVNYFFEEIKILQFDVFRVSRPLEILSELRS